jgi:hypothetical protein
MPAKFHKLPSRDCYQFKPLTGKICSKCGAFASPAHVPRQYVGYFCQRCCPACVGKVNPTKD